MFIRIFYPLSAVLLLLFASLAAAHFENPVDLTLKIEDGSFNLKVRDFKFNGEEIHLDPPDMFKPRKILQLKLQPGRYSFSWTSEKKQVRWSEEPLKLHEKILVLENGDSVVKINIKGDVITMY